MDPLKELKGFDAGRQLALIKKLGGREAVDEILRGRKIVKVEEYEGKKFDKNGRRIPYMLTESVCDPDRKYFFESKNFNSYHLTEKLSKYLDLEKTALTDLFEWETNRLIDSIQTDENINNILKGAWLPIVLPMIKSNEEGGIVEKYLKMLKKSYEEHNPEKNLAISIKEEFLNNFGISHNVGQGRLVRKMKTGTTFGIYFPFALTGFSVQAAEEQIKDLPANFIVSGIDTIIAMTMYPDILLRDDLGVEFNLAGVNWTNNQYYCCSLRFASGSPKVVLDARTIKSSGENTCGLLYIAE